MSGQLNLALAPDGALNAAIRRAVDDTLEKQQRPSAVELVALVEKRYGPKMRWWLPEIVESMSNDEGRPYDQRAYLRALIRNAELVTVLQGSEAQSSVDVGASIDELVRASTAYRGTAAFKEMIEFMGRFRDYAPYNLMLIKLQNPACGFFATEKDWRLRFGRALIDDPRPMLILAPMHPVMLVYDLEQTKGRSLPQELETFAQFDGVLGGDVLTRVIENAARHDGIQIDFKALSISLAGYARVSRGSGTTNFRIAIHRDLDTSSRFGVLCHELAHIYLGHLGGHRDRWWPSRQGMDHASIEMEAEAVAYIVTRQLCLNGSSPAYVSRYLSGSALPPAVSIHLIAKVAGRIKEMTQRSLPARRPPRRQGGARG